MKENTFLTPSQLVSSKEEHDIILLTNAIQTLLLEKNKRYGSSALQPIGIFNKLSSEDSIKIRLDDKLSRIRNSSEVRVNDVADLIGYGFLLLMAKGVNDSEILALID